MSVFVFVRNVVSFLFHSAKTSGKGQSACQFTLGEVYIQMGREKNTNLSYESFQEEEMNQTTFRQVLNGVKTKARGK